VPEHGLVEELDGQERVTSSRITAHRARTEVADPHGEEPPPESTHSCYLSAVDTKEPKELCRCETSSESDRCANRCHAFPGAVVHRAIIAGSSVYPLVAKSQALISHDPRDTTPEVSSRWSRILAASDEIVAVAAARRRRLGQGHSSTGRRDF
jgi:hypothetical protein